VDHQLQQLFYFGLKSEGFFSSNSHFWHPIKICTFWYLGMILPISRPIAPYALEKPAARQGG
jgi:hypothetical protein